MACRKPIITMRSKAIDEFFTSQEIMVCENNAEHLAAAIIGLLEGKDFSDKIANNGYNKFLSLYQKTQEEMKNFIHEMDTALEKC